nr:hypothetical protein [uncultured Flavobacterium sp.]
MAKIQFLPDARYSNTKDRQYTTQKAAKVTKGDHGKHFCAIGKTVLQYRHSTNFNPTTIV